MKSVTLSLPDDTLRHLDDAAATERRSRSNCATVLIERALAAGCSSGSDSRGAAEEASQRHLSEHRRLGGIGPSATTEETP